MSSSASATTVGLGIGLVVGAAGAAAAAQLWYQGASAPTSTSGELSPGARKQGGKGEHFRDAEATMRIKLQGLRIKELRGRAKQAALDEAAIDEALDSEDPKAAMIQLVVDSISSTGPTDESSFADDTEAVADLEPAPAAEVDTTATGQADVRIGLVPLRVKALEKRALAEGLDAEVVEGALDEDNPKASLIELIVAAVQQRGPADRLLSCLSAGGDGAADAIRRVLETAMHVFEQLSVTSPRRERKYAREALESLERACEMVDGVWCDGMSAFGADELTVLVGHLLDVEALGSGTGVSSDMSVPDQVSMVSGMVECLRRCSTSADDGQGMQSGLEEMQALRLTQLRDRGRAEGVDEHSLEDALDSDNPKETLMSLLMKHILSKGPAERMATTLQEGGQACADVISSVLDHALDVLEAVSLSSPRKCRKGLREMMDRVESMLEVVTADWCDGVSRCGGDELCGLSSVLVAVRDVPSSSDEMAATSEAVGEMLRCLDRCGSVAVQSLGVLSGSASSSDADVLSALESLRGMSEEHLDTVCAEEAAAFEILWSHLSSMESCVGDEVVSVCMAVYTVICRNGNTLCGSERMAELVRDAGELCVCWVETLSSGVDDFCAGAAIVALHGLTSSECGSKLSSEARGPVERAAVAMFSAIFKTVGKFTEQRIRNVFCGSMRAGMLSVEDISLACGWCFCFLYLGYMHPEALGTADESGVFTEALTLYRRVEPSPLCADWWRGTCELVDVTSSRLQHVWFMFGLAKRMPSATSASWWSELLDYALSLCKMNKTADLSGRDTMCLMPIYQALSVVEVAAKDDAHHEMLIASGVMDALEYGIMHDFTYVSCSVAANASGTGVALCGRNEGGKVLRREAVHAVLDRLHAHFRPGTQMSDAPPKTVMAALSRVTIMCIADANKKHMLDFQPLIDMLLECLVLNDDNRRKGQDGAEAMQEASAGVLHELSLYGPGAAALRSHADTVSTLHKLCEEGTKTSQERGAAALFELEEDRRAVSISGLADGNGGSSGSGSLPPPHVMASYNWDHQDVILRVVVSLQGRGYLVWIDTEQMKGATVDTMALAVEGAAAVMIGVSRAYKESSNCRMEAQYALQKKKPLVPLMLVEGYEADGWLGLLLGTSMWYGFYGATLSSATAFEARVDALSRELGDRGRADAMVRSASGAATVGAAEVAGASAESSADDGQAMQSELEEMQALRLTQLRDRGRAEGVDEHLLEDALDSDNPKETLIGLLMEHILSKGPAERMATTLQEGGQACADVISSVLDHAMDVLEAVSLSSPRKSRKALLEMMDRVESMLEVVTANWCDGVSRCGGDELRDLSSVLLAVRDVSSSSEVAATSEVVGEMLRCLDRCGSVAVQSLGVLSGSGSCSDADVLSALESLRGMSEEHLDAVCAEEAAAFEMLRSRLSSMESCVGAGVVSVCMAVYTVICRNGNALCGSERMAELVRDAGELCVCWLETLSSGVDDFRAGAAIVAYLSLTYLECGTKMSREARVPVEQAHVKIALVVFKAVATLAEQRIRDVFSRSMRAGMLSQEDTSLACGWCHSVLYLGYMHPEALSTADESGVFTEALTLYRRVEPSPLGTDWWRGTCELVDVTSCRLQNLWLAFGLVKRLSPATSASWWSELLDHALGLCKTNKTAELSGQDTMCFHAIYSAYGIVEVAAKNDAHREMLIASGVTDALEYGIMHDFTYANESVAANASGAAVELLGRNEGGKVLRREAVHAVLDRLHANFRPGTQMSDAPPKTVMAALSRVVTMCIADANKKHMLDFQPLIDMLLECLVLNDDNRRKGQDGAEAMQEVSAGVLHELSLYGPGAAALRSHADTVSTLRKLCEEGTKTSQERGAAALFELEEDRRAVSVSERTGGNSANGGGGGHLLSPHVMASYNWDHQDVILRVVASLQERGYLVWVDTEQMKGATVDTMALAVEGAAAVMIGVSRAYKESSNCRMEAQYALQRKKPLVPLMLVEGYEADGWLGLLLGTSMWYGFYGATLSSATGFEARMDALSRELGDRGRADVVGRSASAAESVEAGELATTSAESFGDDGQGMQSELDELQGLRVTQLRDRGRAEGVDEHLLEDALDSETPKETLIGLLMEHVLSKGPAERMATALQGGGEACADVISSVLDHAMDVLEAVSLSSPRKSRKALLLMMERLESMLEVVTGDWCDGVSRCGGDELCGLSSVLLAVRDVSSSSDEMAATSEAVEEMLRCLDRCGSVAVQSLGVLSASTGAGCSELGDVVRALESLHGLSEERLDAVCLDEAAVFEVLLSRMSGLDSFVGVETVSGCMALYTLGCRNGISLIGTARTVELGREMCCGWLQSASSGVEDFCAGAACFAWITLAGWECGPKMPPDARVAVEAAFVDSFSVVLSTAGRVFNERSVKDLVMSSMKDGILTHHDMSLACGWCTAIFMVGYKHPGSYTTADEAGVFSGALALYRRVEPSPLGSDWWRGTCERVDVTSCRLVCIWLLFCTVKCLPSATSASWWSELLDHALRVSKMNASAGLSCRDTMCIVPVYQALAGLEQAAAKEAFKDMLIASDVTDALEYAIMNDFCYCTCSLSSYASGAAVALVGTNEGGRVLRREAVRAVLDRLHAHFRIQSIHYAAPAKTVMPALRRVTIMAVADTNKKHMLDFEPLIDMLLECLILSDDNRRKGQDGADAMQEVSAGVLHELSLYGPTAAALREHPNAMSTMYRLCEVGSKTSCERGAAALFELDEERRAKAVLETAGAGPGGASVSSSSSGDQPQPPPPLHVMASYNWDHQKVILRVVASLQERGYLVWVDTEQMKGATVDTMALAVEGAAAVMIGVSRAYKESSNCRMEAQYALQKKKPLVPLMLVEGYEADGWLGLLLGMSMWYGFYGATLSSATAFEARVDALSRELGDRGRADVMVRSASAAESVEAGEVAAASADPSADDGQARKSELEELHGLRLKQLRDRGRAEGVGEHLLEDALDSDNPKETLIGLLMEHVLSKGPAERMATALQGGGEACADVISSVLDHAMDVLEAVSLSSPRKSRKGLRQMMERLESMLEVVTADWCDGVSRCGGDELCGLSSVLLAVRDVSSSSDEMAATSEAVEEMLRCLDRCGSVAVQSLGVLSGSASCSDAVVLSALESLRGLSEERLDAVCAEEAAAFEMVRSRLSGMESCVGDEVVSVCMALHTVICRNGNALCGSERMAELVRDTGALCVRWLERLSSGVDDFCAGAAAYACYHLLSWECGPKMSHKARVPVERNTVETQSAVFKAAVKFTERRVRDVFSCSMRADILSQEDTSLVCGWGLVLFYLGQMHPEALSTADESGVFTAALALYRRVEPSPLGADWWHGTCELVDVTSCRLQNLWCVFGLVKRLVSATSSSWWSELLDHAVGLCKTNKTAELSGRDGMCFCPMYHAYNTVEVAAKDDAHEELLIASGVTDALEYGIMHDFTYANVSVAANASGACVELVGRNEGGKVLRREAVHAVLDRLHANFRPGTQFNHTPPKSVMAALSRVATMSIADANKKHMLDFQPLIDMLLECLVLNDDNHRKGQDGTDAMQEASAGVLHELSLYGPGAAALRSHADTVSTLRKLCEEGTKTSQERGAAALFELEEDRRAVPVSVSEMAGSNSRNDGGGNMTSPHVMASYNWDHQKVILRVVASLQERGYLVWVDTEQMKGATVDTMALAVEGAAAVMIGVSRAYKESSNCRMEAQYALQKKKPLVPLMLVEGYEADGWLGLLLGMSMWYGFYGATLSSATAFEARVDALSRELGDRGRAHLSDGLTSMDHTVNRPIGLGKSGVDSLECSPAMIPELHQMKLFALQRRAMAVGVAEDAMEEAMESADQRAALVELITKVEAV